MGIFYGVFSEVGGGNVWYNGFGLSVVVWDTWSCSAGVGLWGEYYLDVSIGQPKVRDSCFVHV